MTDATAPCETCRYWVPLEYPEYPVVRDLTLTRGEWGTCKFVTATEVRTGFESDRAFTSDASGYKSWLTTRADFGCIEHEETK